MRKPRVAIIGSGNIGTDLMFKVIRTSGALEMGALAGIDADSDGLARARKMNVPTTHGGLEGLVGMSEWKDIDIVFDATSAGAHAQHDKICRQHGKRLIDLTPAAMGPYCVPVVNIDATIDQPNINMVSCGGQATIPIVHAVKRVSSRVPYAEVVASMSSKSAGPGTRANIDEVTRTTAKGIESVSGADKGKAIIILNPAEPPLLMRNTIYILSIDSDEQAVDKSIHDMVAEVSAYVPGYRLKHEIQFERFGDNRKIEITGVGEFAGLKSTVFLEVEGAAHYLPAYAGNLDIMTSAGLSTGERVARRIVEQANGR